MKLFFLIFSLALMLTVARGSSVVGSVHDLSVNGGASVKAVSEKNPCVFCHTPHHSNGEIPLWNHALSTVSNYVVYGSARLTNLNVTVPQPNGSSRLCLSCHDGTVALGNITSGAAQITMQGGVSTMPAGVNNVGTDLSNDHPVSFIYDADLAARDSEVKTPAQLPATVKLDQLSRVQCTSCHNPHDNQFGKFLVMDNTASALCLACHQPSQWNVSQHAVSPKSAPAALVSKIARKSAKAGQTTKTSSMAALGCATCHASHEAGSTKHLMQFAAPEQNCLDCHNGGTSKKNLASDFQKPSVHPITLNRDAHSPTEDPVNPKTRHVVCADCHNAHAANADPAKAPNASGALAGVTGVTEAGGVIKPLLKEYELCFRCHGDSAGRGPATLPRQFTETDTRLQFSAGNRSFHPVVARGKNIDAVPSLVSPWTVNSQMYCTDCHNSDSSTKAGGNGANGPHGSIYSPILERNLTVTDNQPESAFAYALCYQCHDRSKVLSNQSFRLHRSHVVDDRTACTTCHDSHGVANNQHLINFNTTYVKPGSLGTISYQSTGPFKGVCTLSCHGVDHKNAAY
jgi:predicted CXXCH cytochrome family protein